MIRYLPDNIDGFFFGHLKNYSEEPDENVWSEIDKSLSDNKTTKRLIPAIPVIGTAAILLFCISILFFINDNFIKDNTAAARKIISSTSNDNYTVTAATLSNTTKATDHFTGNVVNKQATIQELFI